MNDIELSAVVMCFNERAVISSCLDALGFCDEIVVVDDCSTDGTWELLQLRPDVRAFQNRHTTFAAQREYGKARARGRWVLILDADETVTPELARAIRDTISRPDAADAYLLPWRNLYPETLTGDFFDEHLRLVRAEKCRWIPTDDPHSPLDLTGLRISRIRDGHVIHAAPPSVAFLLRKMVNRSLITSTQARAKGRSGGGWKLLGSTLARFVKLYVKRRAWRHGAAGVVMAGVWAFEAYTKHAFLLESPTVSPEALQDGGAGSYPPGTQFVTGAS